ncbi:MAG: PD-(D/E)XK nuclease family protein [Dehalococcoidia bacterium]
MVRPLSYSQISAYQTCSLFYKFQYIDKLPRKAKPYFSFGNTMHRCAQYFFRKDRKAPPDLNDFLDYYERSWVSAGYATREKEEADRALGRKILTTFWELNSRDYRPALATEQWFTIDVGGVPFRGYIDKIDISPGGGLIILDYKSGKREISRADVEESLQLSMYQLGARGIWLLPVEKLSLYHLRTNSVVEVNARDEDTLDEARETVLAVADGISKGEFEPRLNFTCPCDYSQLCPLFNPSAATSVSK